MRALAPAVLLVCMATLLPVTPIPAHAGVTTALECHFDGEPLDAEIGTGGAAVGEPWTLGGAPAIVRSAPFATPSLEIGDDSSTTSEQVRFRFLNDWEFTTGVVEISMVLYFHSLDGYVLYIRESLFSSTSFLNLRFDGGGGVGYGDLDSGGSTQIGTYTAGVALPLTITFDLDAGTYDVDLNGVLIRDNESMGTFTLGVGAILIGADFDADFNGLVSVDDIVVTATQTPSPVEATSWGDVKAVWR